LAGQHLCPINPRSRVGLRWPVFSTPLILGNARSSGRLMAPRVQLVRLTVLSSGPMPAGAPRSWAKPGQPLETLPPRSRLIALGSLRRLRSEWRAWHGAFSLFYPQQLYTAALLRQRVRRS
jgi:hypothetical protein